MNVCLSLSPSSLINTGFRRAYVIISIYVKNVLRTFSRGGGVLERTFVALILLFAGGNRVTFNRLIGVAGV